VSAFWGLLAFLTLSTALLAAGVARGHVTIRRRPKDRNTAGGAK